VFIVENLLAPEPRKRANC